MADFGLELVTEAEFPFTPECLDTLDALETLDIVLEARVSDASRLGAVVSPALWARIEKKPD